MQKSSMREILTRIKHSSLLAWIGYNLAGWGVGILSGFLLGQFAATPIEDSLDPYVLYDYRLEPLFDGIFFWLPLGLCIGIAQWSKLNQWSIQTRGWILATTLGWGLLGTVFAYTSDYFVRQSGPAPWKIFVVELIVVLLGGMFIGLLQSIATKIGFARSRLWILINMFGVLALYVITLGLVTVPFAVKSHILEFFYAHDLYGLVAARDLLLLIFLLISLPIVASFTLFIPTGKLLLRYGIQSFKNDESSNFKTG